MSADGLIEVRIDDIMQHPGETVSLKLVAENGAALPRFDAGSHVDVRIRDGLVRQYSLCGDPAKSDFYRLGVLRDRKSRGGSAAINESLNVGDNITISLPKNHFPLVEGDHYSILLGGGIGITPIIAMAHQLYGTGKSFELRYCVTEEKRAAFKDELLSAEFSDKIHLHFDNDASTPSYTPAVELPPAKEGAHIYVCGPTGFMDWIFKEARSIGYDDAHLHKEDFGAEVDLSGDGFEVEARATGVTVNVAEGQTIVDALTKAGISIDVSCEEGVCGTCLCDVLEGAPDHRDSFLTDEEKESDELIMVCCSRSKSSKLVLDV